MKELTIEEKAKAYDKALEKARQLCAYPTTKPYISDLQDLFPELKESKDEQSKNWILEYLYDGLRKSDEQFKDQFKAAIAWLEKQGEQKHQYKSRPRYIGEEELLGEQVESSVQNKHWKPSDKQMTALRRMKAAVGGEGEIYEPLNSLYEDLKKLREE